MALTGDLAVSARNLLGPNIHSVTTAKLLTDTKNTGLLSAFFPVICTPRALIVIYEWLVNGYMRYFF